MSWRLVQVSRNCDESRGACSMPSDEWDFNIFSCDWTRRICLVCRWLTRQVNSNGAITTTIRVNRCMLCFVNLFLFFHRAGAVFIRALFRSECFLVFIFPSLFLRWKKIGVTIYYWETTIVVARRHAYLRFSSRQRRTRTIVVSADLTATDSPHRREPHARQLALPATCCCALFLPSRLPNLSTTLVPPVSRFVLK